MEVSALKVSEGQWGFVFRKENGKSLRSDAGPFSLLQVTKMPGERDLQPPSL